jgi:predicted MPP superfamily phosphohydrolase
VKRFAVFAIGLCLAGVLAWVAVVETQELEIRELRVDAADGPQKTLAVVSDLHLTDIGARERKLIDLLASLPPGQRLAVLGNWEYWSGIDLAALRRVYAAYDVQLLVNDCHAGIVGLDDDTAGQPDLSLALARCRNGAADSPPLVLLQHSPGFFERPIAPGRAFALSLSGHTHGGQVTLLGWAPWTPPGSGSFLAGEYTTSLGRLYVTRGVGTSLIPLRLGAPPEVLFVTSY